MSKSEGKTGEEEARTPQPKRGLNVLFIIASIIIVLLFLSVGGFLFLQKGKGEDTKLTIGTQTPTPTPSSTVIYLETPPPQAVFYDTFKNNALGWSLSDTTDYIRTLQNGKLTLSNINPDTTLIESLPTNAIYDNFVISVDLTIVKAGRNDSAGVYVRGDSNMDHDYRIDINGDNTFDIAKEYLDSKNNPRTTFLDGPRGSPALNPSGVQNLVKLVIVGPQLVLFINNVEVSSVIDSDYTTGQVALFAHASEETNGVTVSFSRVEVDKTPEK
jgi:3-keto-disaccharide hydrolase